MQAKDTAAMCARELHNGKAVPAEFVVWEARATTTALGNVMQPVMMGRAFACCARHLLNAVGHVFAEGATHAIIRDETAVS